MTGRLFSPISFRDLDLRNRIVVAPMCQYSAIDGSANDWHLMHLGGFAVSGAGLVISEATAVEARGRITAGCMGLYSDENEASFRRIVEFFRTHGGNTRIGIQLAHAGRKASSAVPWEGGKALDATKGAWDTIAPSALPFAEGWHTPSEMDRAEMDRVCEAFVASTERAARLDVDMIELHGAHGYLMSSFLSPLANKRSDEYGGSLENRMRFPLEIFSSVRTVWPHNKPIGVRVSGTDWMDDGWTIEDSVVFGAALKEVGCDMIHVSSGGNSADRPPVGPGEPGYQVPLAERIKAESGIATIAVGMIRDPGLAEDIIASGRADMVALGRGMLYDPRWPWHAAEELGAEVHYPPQYLRCQPVTWPRAFPERAAARNT